MLLTNAIATILKHAGRPVAFCSHILTLTEFKHATVEKKACVIIKAVKKWSYDLLGQNFTIITDQQAVKFYVPLEKTGKTEKQQNLTIEGRIRKLQV